MAGCAIVFSGVVLYKITHHLDKHGKDHEESEGADGLVRYRQVNGSSQTDTEEDAEWMESVPVEMLHSNDTKKAYEMKSVDIQLGLPTVQSEESEEEDDDEDSDSSMRHRIT